MTGAALAVDELVPEDETLDEVEIFEVEIVAERVSTWVSTVKTSPILFVVCPKTRVARQNKTRTILDIFATATSWFGETRSRVAVSRLLWLSVNREMTCSRYTFRELTNGFRGESDSSRFAEVNFGPPTLHIKHYHYEKRLALGGG